MFKFYRDPANPRRFAVAVNLKTLNRVLYTGLVCVLVFIGLSALWH